MLFANRRLLDITACCVGTVGTSAEQVSRGRRDCDSGTHEAAVSTTCRFGRRRHGDVSMVYASMVPDVTPDWRRDLESATQLPRAGVHTDAQHFLPARGKSRVVMIEEREHAAGGRGGHPTMASRCACQRQLEPPRGTTCSESGLADCGQPRSCALGLGWGWGGSAAGKPMQGGEEAGDFCSPAAPRIVNSHHYHGRGSTRDRPGSTEGTLFRVPAGSDGGSRRRPARGGVRSGQNGVRKWRSD